ncbi:MAG TPA: efflux RND transporter periplasmic adaptor subunit [Terriglobales bacterium]|jgi:multidrug efflux pump subunit AcrA (membrane-fusion protein)|nr:efflux RND transporter periplasmic adaptor subunit [Terriglobales bacterium]
MKARLNRIVYVAAAALVAITAGCSKAEKEPEPIVSVQVAKVTQQAITKIIRAEAVLFPLQQSALTPKVSAPVKRFYVNRGSRVKAGQLLATLENRDLAAAAIENKGALAQAQATYATATASGLPEEFRKSELDVEASKQAFDAEQKLFESRQNLFQQGALPRKDLDQARVSLTQAKSQYELARQHWNALQAGGKEQELKSASGQLQSAEGKFQGAQAQLSYSEIRSPIRGIVTDRALYPGEMATAGSPLLVVMDTSSVIAKAHIPQQDAALLKVGASAELSIPGNEDKIAARITVVSPATDPNSTTIEVWALAKNPNNLLRPGTTVQLSITAQEIDGAVVVPASAVLKQPDGSSAVLIAGPDNRAHLQVAQVGIQNGDEVQIISGVKAGEQVITIGGYGLPDKTQIKIESPQPEIPKSD